MARAIAMREPFAKRESRFWLLNALAPDEYPPNCEELSNGMSMLRPVMPFLLAALVSPAVLFAASEAATDPTGGDVIPPAAAAGALAAPIGIPTPAPLGAPTSLGTAPVLPGLGDAGTGMGSPLPAASGAIPTPPPLTGLIPGADAATTGTTTTVAPQGPIDTYEFLFQDDQELGLMRQQYSFDDAKRAKEAEMARFMGAYQVAGQQQQQGQDPRAGAEWDLYYEQLELYSKYVHEQVLQGVPNLPEPKYDAQNYLQDRTDLKNEFDKAAIAALNTQHEENLEFYDRLQSREDRRRRFYDWLAKTQEELDNWAKLWTRKVNGQRWALADEAMRRDDWYYGVNFASPAPKIIQIDGQQFLLSQDPQPKVPENQINVLSNNLTPYDIIDRNGDVKKPELERLRGTMVHAPSEEPTTGTVELLP